MNLFITLLENVNKSRTSANNVSLNSEQQEGVKSKSETGVTTL
jgi:hypothetical protein